MIATISQVNETSSLIDTYINSPNVTEETQSSLTSLKDLMELLTETLQEFLTIVSTNRHRRSAGS